MLDNPPALGTNYFNVGDDIQSLAAGQYYPNQDHWWPKSKLKTYDGEKAKFISNGWFMHDSSMWPPSPSLTPLYVSLHINEAIKNKMLNEQGLKHLKEFAPIGCRDPNTQKILSERGVNSYFSGCLTTTFKREDFSKKSERAGVYFVDVLYKMPSVKNTLLAWRNALSKGLRRGIWQRPQFREDGFSKIFTDEILSGAKYINHSTPVGDSSLPFRVAYARTVLQTYAEAKLVVTSRIHCALPCLAFGTPVIFVNGGLSDPTELCRLEGLSDWFNNVILTSDGQVSNDFGHSGLIGSSIKVSNKTIHVPYAKKMRELCENFIT